MPTQDWSLDFPVSAVFIVTLSDRCFSTYKAEGKNNNNPEIARRLKCTSCNLLNYHSIMLCPEEWDLKVLLVELRSIIAQIVS